VGIRHAVEVTTAVRNIAPMLLMMIFPFEPIHWSRFRSRSSIPLAS
jgi:hypothetical protein